MGALAVFLIILGISIAISLIITGGRILFYILAFADFAIVAGISVYFTHFQWGWHLVFTIVAAGAVCFGWFMLMQIERVKKIIPIPILGVASYFVVGVIGTLIINWNTPGNAELLQLDIIWHIFITFIATAVLAAARFSVLGET